MNGDMYVDHCIPAAQVDLYCNTLIKTPQVEQQVHQKFHGWKINVHFNTICESVVPGCTKYKKYVSADLHKGAIIIYGDDKKCIEHTSFHFWVSCLWY